MQTLSQSTGLIKTVIEHFESGVKEFSNELEFMMFVRKIHKENEGNENVIIDIYSYKDALIYMFMYCDNFKVIRSGILEVENYSEITPID
jgi:hypothetical protein